MKQYLRRSAKYFIYLIVLFAIIFTFMSFTGAVEIKFSDFGLIFENRQGVIMIAAIVALCLAHPLLGYVKRPLNINITDNKKKVVDLFNSLGFEKVLDDEQQIIFKAKSTMKKLTMLYEDDIVINKTDFPITIQGNRRAVTSMLFRIESLKNS